MFVSIIAGGYQSCSPNRRFADFAKRYVATNAVSKTIDGVNQIVEAFNQLIKNGGTVGTTEEHLSILRAGVQEWNYWRSSNPEIIPTLAAGTNLNGTDFSVNVDLSGVVLASANLKHARLLQANLFRADLSGVNLSSAELVCANLFKSNLTGTKLTGADLDNANLRGATGLTCDQLTQARN